GHLFGLFGGEGFPDFPYQCFHVDSCCCVGSGVSFSQSITTGESTITIALIVQAHCRFSRGGPACAPPVGRPGCARSLRAAHPKLFPAPKYPGPAVSIAGTACPTWTL